MHVTVSARHNLTLDHLLRDRALEVLDRLDRMGDRALEGTVVFDTVAGQSFAEIRLHCAGGQVLVATAEAGDHRSALDQVEERLRRQLRRVQKRPLAQRHTLPAT
jgi:ribosomal subunit interface protein